jgi:hypothetical protein
MPGAGGISVLDAELSPDGQSLAVIANGADAGRAFVSTLGFGTPANGIAKLVKLESFAAQHIAFAPDGTLWALGREYDANLDDRAEYNLLRHFGRDGVLIGGALPRSAVARGPSPISPSTDSILVAGADRLGVLSIATRQWLEVSLEGRPIGSYPVQLAPATRITGAAIAPEGDVFFSTETDSAPQLRPLSAREAIAIRKLDKASGHLVEVDTSALRSAPHQGVLLLGSEGDRLVVRVKPPWRLSWVEVN